MTSKSTKRFLFLLWGLLQQKIYLTYAKTTSLEKGLRNIEFTKCSLKDMLDLYSRASFVALTSFQETLPMSVLEAMASGTPVLVSNIKPMRYIVEDGVTGLLVNSSDPRGIAEKILLLIINDSNLRKRIGLNARLEAERRWRSEVIAKEHLKLYESLVMGIMSASNLVNHKFRSIFVFLGMLVTFLRVYGGITLITSPWFYILFLILVLLTLTVNGIMTDRVDSKLSSGSNFVTIYLITTLLAASQLPNISFHTGWDVNAETRILK